MIDLNNPKMIGPYDPEANWKRALIIDLARRFEIKSFIETGTSWGDTIDAVKDSFNTIHTVELSTELYFKALERFKDFENIYLWNDSSINVLSSAIKFSDDPILFWLDAHPTAEFPGSDDVNQELKIIAEMAPDSLVLIDDVKPTEWLLSKEFKDYESPGGPINIGLWPGRFLHGVLILHKGGYDIPEVF